MKTTVEVAIEMLVKLSDELKTSRQFDTITDSDARFAYLYAMSFFENSTNLIAAIVFVDDICLRIEKASDNATAETVNKLQLLLHASDTARRWLYTFTDELRAEFDEHKTQKALNDA